MAAIKATFVDYLNSVSLDASQIYFVNQIIEYIVRNDMMQDSPLLQEALFIANAALWKSLRIFQFGWGLKLSLTESTQMLLLHKIFN